MDENTVKKIIIIGVSLLLLYIIVNVAMDSLVDDSKSSSGKKANKVTAYVSDTNTTKSTHTTRVRRKGKSRTRKTTTTTHHAYLNYEVDGKKYTRVHITQGASSLKKGQNCTVYYYPENPGRVELKARYLDDTSNTIIELTPVILVALTLAGAVVYSSKKKNP